MNNSYLEEDYEKVILRENKQRDIARRHRSNVFKNARHTNGSIKRTEAQLKKFNDIMTQETSIYDEA